MGQGRAGFYSDSPWWDAAVDFYYRVLSREQGRTRVRYQKRDTAIVPEWQDLRVGDAILDGPPGTAYYVVRRIEPIRSLVRFTDTHLPYLLPARLRDRVSAELTDALVLMRLTDSQTRVVRRVRMACRPLAFRLVAVPVVLIWGEITARNFLRGVKRRAEMGSLTEAGTPSSRRTTRVWLSVRRMRTSASVNSAGTSVARRAGNKYGKCVSVKRTSDRVGSI